MVICSRLTIDMVEDDNGQPTGEVKALKIKYFDTVPCCEQSPHSQKRIFVRHK